MDLVFQDCRLAARHLGAAWPFAAAAVVTLALGIGANVMLFSLADSVIFRPLPLRDADRIVIADLIALHRTPWKANLALFGVFAWLTVLLASVGLYGLLASTVAERTREIGVRLALGAGARRIVRLVLGDGVRIALWGVAAGALAAFAGTRLIRTLLFETSPLDPAALAAAPMLLLAIAIVACALPAIRATRIDPAISLRAE
jgi:ABC-type antimicrobial peptide transport system permease subunit